LLVRLLALLLFAPAAHADEAAVRQLLDSGRCEEAASAAEGDPALARALGDARRCLGQARPAVLAYQQHLELNGPDPSVDALIEGLRERLASVRVDVQLDRPAPLRVTASLADRTTVDGVRRPDGSWGLADLPPGAPVAVKLVGVGVEATATTSPVLRAGVETLVTLRPSWLGIGSVSLSGAPPAGVEAVLLGPEGDVPLRPGDIVKVTAGAIALELRGPRGSVAVPATVAEGGTVRVDPKPWWPTSLVVAGAPAGAALRLFLEGVEPPLDRVVAVPVDGGTLDPRFGLLQHDAFVVDGLVGGPGSLVVEHERLGVVALELVLEPGLSNPVTVPTADLPGLPALTGRWNEWKQGRAAVVRKARAPVVVSLGVGGAATLLSAVAWAGAGTSGQRVSDAKSSALAGTAHPTGGDWFADHASASASERGWTAVGIAAGALGGVGFGVSGVFGGRAQQAVEAYGGWAGR